MKTAKVRLTFDGRRFHAICTYDSRALLREAGFNWSVDGKFWYTSNPRIAARLREYADESAEEFFQRHLLRVSPWASAIPYPPWLRPLPFQIPAARFSLERNHSYQFASPGMGKTIIAALIMNALHAQNRNSRFVYICPAFLTRNVESEMEEWGLGLDVEHYCAPRCFGNVLILPSSLFHRENLREDLLHFTGQFKFSSNAEIRRAARDLPANPGENVLIVDEAHQFKNDEAERTRVLLGHTNDKGVITHSGLVKLFDRTICMSGTAMPNRPLELYPILSTLAPETIDFMTKEQYGMRYCAGRWNGYAYEYTGASNLLELGKRVKGTYMHRLKKSELKLPPLTEEIFVVSDDAPSEMRDFEAALQKDFSVADLMYGKIAASIRYHNMPLPTYQRQLGLYKVKHAVAWAHHLLENTNDRAIIFTRHIDVASRIDDALCKSLSWKPWFIGAHAKPEDRVAVVNHFNASKTRRILIALIGRAGVGLNVQSANRILHVEPQWNPAVNDQGTDRAHRYGQEKHVHAEYMVYKNSIDHVVMKTILKKRKLGSYL